MEEVILQTEHGQELVIDLTSYDFEQEEYDVEIIIFISDWGIIYIFVLNNPYKYTDPSGHIIIPVIAVFLIILFVTGELLKPETSPAPIIDRYFSQKEDSQIENLPTKDTIREATPEEIEAMKEARGNLEDEEKKPKDKKARDEGSVEVDGELQSSNEYTSNYDSYASQPQGNDKSSLSKAFGVIKDFMMANPGMTEAEATEKYKRYSEFESKKEGSNYI